MTLDDIKAVARSTAPAAGPAGDTLDVTAGTAAGGLVDLLTGYFGEDDTRSQIRLLIGGEEIGYLQRADLYALASASEKGIGSSDYGTLPGQANYRLIRLRCPVAACTETRLVMTFDEDDPPACGVHPDRWLQVAS